MGEAGGVKRGGEQGVAGEQTCNSVGLGFRTEYYPQRLIPTSVSLSWLNSLFVAESQ